MAIEGLGQIGKLSFESGLFIFRTDFHSRVIAKEAGFWWNPERKFWYTVNPLMAARLRKYADPVTETCIAGLLGEPKPFAGAISYPKHLSPYKFQIERAVPWALARDKTYLALDPGLGKTICAALVINSLGLPATYVCPPFLRTNVETELAKWAPEADVEIVSDTLLKDRPVSPDSKILIVDEAHRFKTPGAQRTKHLLKMSRRFRHQIFLSGTPMPNRPIELFSILNAAAPETIGFRNYVDYGMHYCAGFKGEWGYDFSGVSNFRSLIESVHSSFMLRIKKSDVLEELPPKLESLVFVGGELSKEFAELERAILRKHKPESLAAVVGDEHLSTYRKNLGVKKADDVVKFVKELLSETDESLLLFGIHKEAIHKMAIGLKDFQPLVITGDVATADRHQLVGEFQNNPEKRLMILNIQAGGVGFNLTKATRVVFAETPWVPAEIDQAADRCHRIGQTGQVYVQFLVYKNSLDAIVLDAVLNKRRLTENI